MKVHTKTKNRFECIKNESAFTLVELLAVIVILAIVALIATPIVLNIIKDIKDNATLRSADFYLDAVEYAAGQSKLIDKKIENKTYNILANGNICLKYKEDNITCEDELVVNISNETPIKGTITIKNNKIKDIKLKYENGKVIVYGDNKNLIYFVSEPYQESENIEIPDLYNNTLTPVIYDGNKWIVADVTEKWYDYSKQEWANAVILNNNINKKVGDVVTVEGTNPDALAMFVWIPRYEYKIDGKFGKNGISKTSPGEIDINFINRNITAPTENYRIHPAFNFAGEDISGIWVGKFELSHVKKTSSLGCITETCSESDGLRILPNMRSLTNNNVSSFFYAIKSMSKEENVFGIKSSKIDPHMIKNSEWGAIAYLSQSKYGKYGNSDYEGVNKEVYMNNSSSYYTGRSGGSYGGNTAVNTVYFSQPDVIDQYIGTGYYTYDGYLLEYNKNNKTSERRMNKIASTTGNIYGIYDMSGSAWEYVMGVFTNSSGEKWSHNSGFEGKIGTEGIYKEGLAWPNEKYYDIYKASSETTITSTTACDGGVCYGHAFSETAGWYDDASYFIGPTIPWFKRGGNFANVESAGVFFFYGNSGGNGGDGSSRVVLVPTI